MLVMISWEIPSFPIMTIVSSLEHTWDKGERQLLVRLEHLLMSRKVSLVKCVIIMFYNLSLVDTWEDEIYWRGDPGQWCKMRRGWDEIFSCVSCTSPPDHDQSPDLQHTLTRAHTAGQETGGRDWGWGWWWRFRSDPGVSTVSGVTSSRSWSSPDQHFDTTDQRQLSVSCWPPQSLFQPFETNDRILIHFLHRDYLEAKDILLPCPIISLRASFTVLSSNPIVPISEILTLWDKSRCSKVVRLQQMADTTSSVTTPSAAWEKSRWTSLMKDLRTRFSRTMTIIWMK